MTQFQTYEQHVQWHYRSPASVFMWLHVGDVMHLVIATGVTVSTIGQGRVTSHRTMCGRDTSEGWTSHSHKWPAVLKGLITTNWELCEACAAAEDFKQFIAIHNWSQCE